MSLRILSVGYVILVMVVIATGVSAQSLQDRKMQQSDDKMLAAEIAYTNQLCHSNIEATVDWQSFSTENFAAAARPLESCDAVLGAIESICADQIGQKAVSQHITHVVCVKGASREVDLKQGTLFFQIEGSLSDNFQFVREYLIGEVADLVAEE